MLLLNLLLFLVGTSLPELALRIIAEGCDVGGRSVALCWVDIAAKRRLQGAGGSRVGRWGLRHGLPFPLVCSFRVGDSVMVGEMPFKKFL